MSPGASPLQWSKAVKGLCLFAIHAKKQVPFEGGRGSYAAALDFALSKGPRWLVDLFGENANGVCHARRIIKRRNPELKSGETCTLTLNECMLPYGAIELYVGNDLISQPEHIDRLLLKLLYGSEQLKSEEQAQSGWKEFLFSIYQRELQRSFQWRTPFSKHLRLSYFQSLRGNSSVQHLFPVNSRLGNETLNELMNSHPDNIGRETCWSSLIGEVGSIGRPLRLAMSAPGCPLVITNYLKSIGFSIESDWRYTHAGYVAEQVAQKNIEDIDGFYAALTPSLAFVARDRLKNFVPVSLLPQTNHSIVSNSPSRPRSMKKKARKTILLGKEITSAHLVHSELAAQGQWDGSKDILGEDPDIVAYHLKEDSDPINAILFFPFCDIVSELGSFSAKSAENAPSVSQPFILFLRRDLPHFERVTRALQIAFKHAWLELSESKKELDCAINDYLAIEGLPQYLARISGASALPGYSRFL